MALRARKVSGVFEKRAPDPDHPKECTQSQAIHCKLSRVRVKESKKGARG